MNKSKKLCRSVFIFFAFLQHVEENGAVPAIELLCRRNSQNETRTSGLLSQCKNPSSCLSWENDSTVSVNENRTQDPPLPVNSINSSYHGNHFSSHTFPRATQSATNSPRRHRLTPDTDHITRSPSASPKLKKRTVVAPSKPSQIDNSPLIVPNPHKVRFVKRFYNMIT